MSDTAVLSAEDAFTFDNSYARELDGFYAPVQAEPASAPRIVKFNSSLASELGLPADLLNSPQGAEIFSGNKLPRGAQALAQAYAGHQFGGFSPQLGDGRALLMGEMIDSQGKRWDLQLKGSGRTPFSRRGDGKAALGPVLREYLISEAMQALAVPTTRALAAVATGDPVFRNTTLPGGVLARVAASHVRVGTFQYFAARGENAKVQQLADYVIQRHYPQQRDSTNPYLGLLNAIMDRQASLVARWMHVGFIHGVMNTDNMTVSGETIDYGPCAFMDRYDPKTVFSSIDHYGRYAYANQPVAAQWNLARLAETLLPLMDEDKDKAVQIATDAIEQFMPAYTQYWLQGMRAKLGLPGHDIQDQVLVDDWLGLLNTHQVDYTLAMRRLADVVPDASETGEPGRSSLTALFGNADDLSLWLDRWRNRLGQASQDPLATSKAMRQVNPLFIPRNHLVEQALTAAVEENDYQPFDKLLSVVTKPFDSRADFDDYTVPAPIDGAPYLTFCGT